MNEVVKSDLPENWILKPIGEIVQPTRPRVSPSEKSDLQFLGMDHIEANTMRQLGSVPAVSMKSSAVHFQPGDVLYGRLRPYLNKVFQPHFEGLCSAEFIVFPEADELNNKYLQYFLNSSRFVRHATSLNSGDRPRVKFEQFSSYCIPLPPTVEQQKHIVAKIEELFSHVDAGIEALKKAQKLLKQYRQSVLKAAVTGELTKEWREANKDKLEPGSQLLDRILKERRHKWEERQLEQFKAKGKMPKDDKWKKKYKEPTHEVESFFEVQDGWAWTEIGTITDMLSGHAFKKSEYTNSGVRLFQIANVSFGNTKWDDIEHLPEAYLKEWGHLELKEGDVLMALNRPLLSKQLKISRLGKSDVPAILYQRVGKFQFYSEIVSDYFLLYMQSHYYINKLEEQLQGVNIPFINKGKLLETPISIPAHEEEITLIVEISNTKLDLIKRLEIEIDNQMSMSVKSKESILSAAFSGKLIKNMPLDEDAIALLDKIKESVSKAEKSYTNNDEPKKKTSLEKIDLISIIQKEFGEKVFSISELFDACDREDLSVLKFELFELLKKPRKDTHRLDMQFDDNTEQYIFRLILRSLT